jgi:chaperonin GroES
MAVGLGKISDSNIRLTMEIKVGDKVLYGKYSGTEVKIGDVEYMIMHTEDILAVIG